MFKIIVLYKIYGINKQKIEFTTCSENIKTYDYEKIKIKIKLNSFRISTINYRINLNERIK